MSLSIILGKPKTGKTSYIFEQIENDIKTNKNVILFVPSQQRLETENKYIDCVKSSGIIGVNITTIGEYVKDCIKKIGISTDDKYLSKQDKKIILADVISKMQNRLKLFKNVSKKDGFLDLMYIYIDLLRKSNFDYTTIDKLNIENKLVLAKLKEICQIYKNYLNQIEDRFIDSVDEVEIFLKNISKINLSNTNIYIDSYNNFTKSEFSVIEALINLAENVSISLNTDISCANDIYSLNTNEIFETSNATYLKLLSIANKNTTVVENKVMCFKKNNQEEDIKYLSDNIFSNEKVLKKDSSNVYVNLYSNILSESKGISKIINEKIRQGYRYKDFDIYTTDVKKYKDIISRVFFETKIPVYINLEENILSSKLVTYILKYLELLKNGIKSDILVDILKLRLTDIDIKDIFEFENYILEFNINDYYITKPFIINNKNANEHIYDLENLNKIRENIISIYDVDIPKEENPKNYIKLIYDHLNSYVLEKYSTAIISADENTNEFDISNINKEKQVWDRLCEVFNSISKICDEKITFEKFVYIFRLAIKDVTLKSTPPVIDSVSLLDINTAKQRNSKIVFFVGVNENEFPKISQEDIMFSDMQLNTLKDSGIELKQTTISKDNMAKYNIYYVLNSIKEKLYISIPTSDYSGKSLKPSFVINEIKKLLNLKVNSYILDEGTENIENLYSKNELLEYLLKKLDQHAKDNFDIIYIYEYLKQDTMYDNLFNYKKNDDNLTDETLKLIYSNNESFNTSVSKLELFKKCPFSYYMKYLLKIEPRKEFEISSLDIGSFMHEVLEKFSKYLFTNNIPWQALLVDNIWQEKLYNIIDEKLEEKLGNKTGSVKYVILKEKLINTMKKVVIVIANSFNQSEFVPYGYEIEFKEGKLFAPISIKLSNNKTMNIIGKIDRVDVLKLEKQMYVRVIDYKSSKKDLKLEDIKEGLSLQLVTYLASFIKNVSKQREYEVKPAGMLYFNLSDKLVNLKGYLDDDEKVKNETIKALRMKGIFLKDVKIIEKMDNKLTTEKKLIDVSKSTLNKDVTNRALTLEEYENLFEDTKQVLKDIGEDIINGTVKIKPNKKSEYCKFCNYSSICRKGICL